MAAIYRNVNGTYTMLSADVGVGPAAGEGLFIADSFSFGVEREMKDGTIDADAFDLKAIEAGEEGTIERPKTWRDDRPMTWDNVTNGSGDVFDFQAMEAADGAGEGLPSAPVVDLQLDNEPEVLAGVYDVDLTLTDMDKGPLPVSMPEYALMIELI
jgi:hypothetical protein